MLDIALAVKKLAVSFVPLMLGIILHEVAHGYMANRCGDATASRAGRLTLNPVAHADGTGLLFFVLTGLFSPITLGWAKPVPIDPRRFGNLTRDLALVALAGPLTNFLLAVLFAAALKLLLCICPYADWPDSTVHTFLLLMLYSGVSVNFALGWFNLIPVPPLDGSKLLWCVLPPKAGWEYMRLERFGILIILLLALTNILDLVIFPPIEYSINLLLAIFGLK